MIFFDIDDTLLDYQTSQDVAAIAFAKKYNQFINDPENFPAIWDQITKHHMNRYLKGDISFQEQRRCRIQESLGIRLSPKDADNIFSEYYEIYEASWQLFPDVILALNKLSEYSLSIITNGDKKQQTYKLEKLGISSYFNSLITPECAGAAKPDAAIFKLASSQFGKGAEECWYIGDNYIADYQGAKNAGFKSVWLNRNNQIEACNHQCQNLNDFVLILKNENQ